MLGVTVALAKQRCISLSQLASYATQNSFLFAETADEKHGYLYQLMSKITNVGGARLIHQYIYITYLHSTINVISHIHTMYTDQLLL
jgi:hypothetical protein